MLVFRISYSHDFWRSCDTEDWSNDAGNTALITEIHCILTHIHIKNTYHNISVFMIFLMKCMLTSKPLYSSVFTHSQAVWLFPDLVLIVVVVCVTVEMEHRIDYELREGMVESRYWSAVTSHTAYWTSHDVALFLLTFIYKQQSTSPM